MFSARGNFLVQPASAGGAVGSAYLNNSNNGTNTASMLQIVNPPTALVNYNATTGYTLEYWCYVPNWANVTTGTGFGIGNLTNTNFQYWSIGIYQRTSTTGGITSYFFAGGFPTAGYTTVSLSANTWFHVAANFAIIGGNTVQLTIYVNGTSIYQSGTVSLRSGSATTTPFSIGPRGGQASNAYFDEIRVSDVARYTGNFTPATAPFTSDANTLLLMHCDGTQGQTTFTDSSGSPKTITQLNSNSVIVDTTIYKF